MRDRYTDFEATFEGDEGSAPEPEPELTEPEAEEPEAPSAWAPSQDEWGQVTGFINAAAPILQQIAYQQQMAQQQGYAPQQQYQQGYEQQPQYQEQEEFDPFDPESVQRYIAQQVQDQAAQMFQSSLGPYEGLLGMVASQQGEQLARSELDTIRGELGEFDEDAAFLVASGLIEQGGDPSIALRQSAQYAQEWESRIRADEREKYKGELQNLQSAPRETPVGGASAANEEGIPRGQGRYEEAIRRALANRHPIQPVG
jgi:hypothetical protein